MILQALARYYEDQLRRGAITPPGWMRGKIAFAICLGTDGAVEQLIPTLREVQSGKKTVLLPQEMTIPAPVKKTVNVAANFLCDNSGYLLGVDQKGKPERTRQCFDAAVALHHELLDGVDSDCARAILAFFDTWNPEEAKSHPALASCFDEVTAGGNLVFRVNGCYAQQDERIAAAWQEHYDKEDDTSVRMQCLISGSEDAIVPVHPALKGVRGAQTSGAALVSFNAHAFWSFGHEQNYNAPIGKHAAFAYTTALNSLLADRDHVQQIGDATVVCWADGAEPAYQDVAAAALFGAPAPASFTENDLFAAVRRLADGLPCTELNVEPGRAFYILGLSPNAARLSVRFFLCDSFGALMRHVDEHYRRLEIVRPSFAPAGVLTPWAMLRETVNLNSRDKEPSPAMAGATMRAIFSGGMYPVSLLEATMLRIRAERNITWGRAAILKAYYLKNTNPDCPKEVLTVSLNENSTNAAYTLGRLFAVYEDVQQEANPGINTTIKDKYLNAASSAPATVFPILFNLSQKHLRKLDDRKRIWYENQIMQLKGILGETYPARQTLAQQGSFDLGYYHQRQKRFTKKEEYDNGNDR